MQLPLEIGAHLSPQALFVRETDQDASAVRRAVEDRFRFLVGVVFVRERSNQRDQQGAFLVLDDQELVALPVEVEVDLVDAVPVLSLSLEDVFENDFAQQARLVPVRLSMPSDGDMPQSCAQNLRVALSDREA